MIRVAIFDLDGVIRHFDPQRAVTVADTYALSLDAMWDAAFAPTRMRRLVTGGMTRKAWVAEVGEVLGSPEGAERWLCQVGVVDPAVMAVVKGIRDAGYPVGILTNGTDEIPAELDTLGIRSDFDHVVSTWGLGVAKPDPEAYLATCKVMGVSPTEVFFTDDRAENVAAARALGLVGHLFEGAPGLAAAWEAARDGNA